MTTESRTNNRFELHYLFNEGDKTHTMDAVVRNKCEYEFLQIISAISKELNFQIKVETEAYDEGGLVEFYTFICSADGHAIIELANLTMTILAIILSKIPGKKSKLDIKEQQLNIEEKRLSVEEKKLNILKIQKELDKKEIHSTNINIDKIEYIVNNNIKISKHKSNYYKALSNYPKVKQISTAQIDSFRKPLEEPEIIERKDFDKFILESDNLDPISDENATIEIVSPVLKKGKYKWKGIYDKIGSVIEFTMKDKEFKKNVIETGIPFKNGTFIDCTLKIERKIDDLGVIFNSNYSVLAVLRQHDENMSFETNLGKKHRQQKEAEKHTQYKLFDDEEFE